MWQCGYATNERMPIAYFYCTFALNILPWSILMQDINLCDNEAQHYKQKLYDIHNRC